MANKPTPENCPDPSVHGNPFRYCPFCSWIEAPVSKIEEPVKDTSKPDFFRGVCVYEVQDWVFTQDKETFRQTMALEISSGNTDILTYFMEEWEKRNNAAQ